MTANDSLKETIEDEEGIIGYCEPIDAEPDESEFEPLADEKVQYPSLKSNVMNVLEEMPTAINTKAKIIYEDKKKYEEMMLALKSYELTIKQQVEAEKDDAGKAKYSNAEKRQIETDMRLAKSNEYLSMDRAAKDLKNEIDINAIQLEYLNNQFKAARSMALLMGDD